MLRNQDYVYRGDRVVFNNSFRLEARPLELGEDADKIAARDAYERKRGGRKAKKTKNSAHRRDSHQRDN